MLDIKKLLAKILNWSGFKFTWDANTENTTDSWILVTKDYTTIQHRVLPSNADASLTKYGSVWTGGNINLHRRGNLVLVTGNPTFSKTTARVQIGTIPSGFIPADTAYIIWNGTTEYMLFNPNGTVQINATGAGRKYFSGCYAVN